MSITMQPTTTTANSNVASRNVRCLIVGEDLDLGRGSFALSVDEDMTVEQLRLHVLQHIPPTSQERIGSELQLFKGFDLYTPSESPAATPVKKSRRASLSSSPIDELLQTLTPEKTVNKYFQPKYAMRKRASLGEYLPRGRKCERSRIDVLVSVPKFQLSEDLAALETEAEDEEDDHLIDFGFESSDMDQTEALLSTVSPLKRKRDPVVDEAETSALNTPTKWQRAPCGRIVSVGSLRLRLRQHRCCAQCWTTKHQ